MSNSQSARIHPTAVISAEAELADDVQVGPCVVIEGAVRIGPGCVIRPHACLFGLMTLGRDNIIYSGAVLGERPQHLKFGDEPTRVEIGDSNVFRENVTVHRGTTQSWLTQIGSHNFLMAGAHVAHDCRVGNHCIIANGALLGGHSVLEDNVYLSGNCAIHQFCRVGRLAMLSGVSGATKDIPPFVVQQGINCVVGVNVVGMHRAGMSNDEINAVRRAFHILFKEGQVMPVALLQVEQEVGNFDAARELVQFIRQSKRGVSAFRDPNRRAA